MDLAFPDTVCQFFQDAAFFTNHFVESFLIELRKSSVFFYCLLSDSTVVILGTNLPLRCANLIRS